MALIPVATITDASGGPIFVGGAILQLEYSPIDADTALATYGLLSSSHVWAGFRSNIPLPGDLPLGFTESSYAVTYTWPMPVGATGSTWCSDTLEEYPDAIVYDGFGSFPPVGQFSRGDTNVDGGFDIADAIFTLSALFTAGSPQPGCANAADSNDDGNVDIGDAIYTLSALFVVGSGSPGFPFPDCGHDPPQCPMSIDTLDCADYDGCP